MNKFFKNILNASLEDWATVTDTTLVTKKPSKVLTKSVTGAVFIATATLSTPVFSAEGNAGGEIAGKGSTAISECGASSPYDGTLEAGEAHAGAIYSIAIGCNTDVGSQNSVAIGGGPTPETGAKIGTNSNNSVVLGQGEIANNSANTSIIGSGKVGEKSENTSILGKGVVGTQSANSSIIGSGVIGDSSANTSILGRGTVGDNSSDANVLGLGTIGNNAQNASILGRGEVGNNSSNASILGRGEVGNNSANASIIGSGIIGDNSANASVLGKGTIGTNSVNANILGAGTIGDNASNASIIGTGNITNGSKNSISIGTNNTIKGQNIYVLGSEIEVELENSVILGNASTLDKVYLKDEIEKITIQNKDINLNGFEFAGTHTNNQVGAVSVGSAGQERQIQHVGAGRITADSTDAVNGSQLYYVLGAAKLPIYLNDGQGGSAQLQLGDTFNIEGAKITVDANGNPILSIPKGTTKVVADKNINVQSQEDANGEVTYTVATKDDVDFNNVNINSKLTAGDVVIDATTNDIKGLSNTGIGDKALPDFATVGRGATEEQLNQTAGSVANIIGGGVVNNNGEVKGPFTVNNNQYNNIADAIGSESAAAKTKVDEGKNITVDVKTGDDGENIYTVSTKDDVDFNNVNINNKLTVGQVIVDATTNDIRGLSNTGIGNQAPKDFATVGRGATEEQLNQTAGSIANIIGGGVVNNNGDVTGPFIVNGKEYANIADAIGSESSAAKVEVDAGKNIKVEVGQDANGKSIYTVSTQDDVEFNNVDVKDKLTAGNVVIDANTNDIKGLSNTGIGDKALPDFATVGRGATEEQLNQSVGSVANIIGGGTTNNNGQITGPFTVNGKQYNNVADAIGSEASAAKTSVEAGKNMQVSIKQDSDGRDVYTVATKDNVEFNNVDVKDKLTVGNVTVDANTNDIKGLSNTGIGNQAPPDFATVGRGATEEQLKQSVGSIANIIGGGIVNNNGEVTGPVTVHGNTYNTLVDAISANYTEVIGGNNINVTSSIGSSGQTIYSVATTDRPSFTEVNVGGKITINDNGINMGNTQITNLADGTEIHHAVNLGQLNTSITNVENKFNTRINGVENRMSAGIAAAMAMEAAPYVAGKYTYAAGTAYYNNQSAFGVNLRKTADNGRWALTGGVAAGTEGDPSIRFGLSGVID